MNRSYIIAMIKSQSTNYILIEFTSVNEMYKSPKKNAKICKCTFRTTNNSEINIVPVHLYIQMDLIHAKPNIFVWFDVEFFLIS